MRDNIRDFCIGITMLVVLIVGFIMQTNSADSCQKCDRMEQAMSGMRQRMAPQQQRGSRSSEGRGEWRKDNEKGEEVNY